MASKSDTKKPKKTNSKTINKKIEEALTKIQDINKEAAEIKKSLATIGKGLDNAGSEHK